VALLSAKKKEKQGEKEGRRNIIEGIKCFGLPPPCLLPSL
jgi:hypothetical protein